MPTLLTFNPESYAYFGVNLTGYLEQPGAFFAIQRYGFDTGRRRFLVNTTVADTDRFLPNMPDLVYPHMYVDKVVTEKVSDIWSFVDIDYLGLITDKDPAISTDTDTRYVRLIRFLPGAVGSFPFWIPETTVQVVYISLDEPNLGQAGSPYNPPITIPAPDFSSWMNGFGFAPTIVSLIWILEKRSYRVVGGHFSKSGAPGGSSGRVISGGVTFEVASRSLHGDSNTKFLSELQPGNQIIPLTYWQNGSIAAAGTIASVSTDHFATLQNEWTNGDTVPVPGETFFDAAFVVGNPPGPANIPGLSIPIYEVTDSYRRILDVG